MLTIIWNDWNETKRKQKHRSSGRIVQVFPTKSPHDLEGYRGGLYTIWRGLEGVVATAGLPRRPMRRARGP
eukprot:662575-Prorocentrum_minimum.AAC.1